MTQSIKSVATVWLAVAFFATLSGAMWYRNDQLVTTIARLEGEINTLQSVDALPADTSFDQPQSQGQVLRRESTTEDSPNDDFVSPEEISQSVSAADSPSATEALAALLASNALTETIEDLELQFEDEPFDPSWSNQQAISVQTEFVSNMELLGYSLSEIECRTTMCKGIVHTQDGQPIEEFGISLAASLTSLESVALAKMKVEDVDPTSVKVIFERKESTQP